MVSNEKYGSEILIAHEQQTHLGNDLLWKGVIVQKFGDIQENIYRDKQYSNSQNGTVWARRVVEFFHKHFENIWDGRNVRLNKKTEGKSERKEISEKLQEIDQKGFYVP